MNAQEAYQTRVLELTEQLAVRERDCLLLRKRVEELENRTHSSGPTKDEFDRLINRVANARKLIIADAKGQKGVAGAIACPDCGKEQGLRYKVQRNGHVWAQGCCFNWIE